MSTYDFPISQIPMESLRRIAEMSAELSDSLVSSGLLDVCKSAQQMLAASTAASREASQIVSQAMQPLLDCLAKLADELPSPADTLQSLADKIDDSVLDETSAAIEEALPYMEPEARDYCVTEALPKLAPEERKTFTWRDACLLIQTLAAIAGAATPLLKDDQSAQTPPASPAAIIQQTETSDDRLQGANDSFLIFDDNSQTGYDVSEVPDPGTQVQDVERHDQVDD